MNQFPYTNFHDVNLDWLLKQTKENTTDITNVKQVIENIPPDVESEIATINSEINALQNEIENISSLYLCTFGVTTNSEIETALNDQKLPICIYDGHIYVISQRVSANRHRFGCVYRTESKALECLFDSWFTQDDTFASKAYVDSAIAAIPPDVFIAEYEVTSYADLLAAYNDGKYIVMKRQDDPDFPDSTYAVFCGFESDTFYFYDMNPSTRNFSRYRRNATDWYIQNQGTLALTNSPHFTGVPTAPTAATGTDTTQIASTEFVQQELNSYIQKKIINRFNKTTISSGYYLNVSNGQLASNAAFFASDYIYVGDLAKVKCSGTHIVCFYDNNYAFISGQGFNTINNDDSITRPPTATYFRFSTYNGDLNTAQIGDIDIDRSNYVEYGKYTLPDYIPSENKIIVDIAGNGNYTSLTEALFETIDSGITIEVMPGTYDLHAEYISKWGATAVDNMADTDTATFNGFQFGAIIRNRKVIFDAGAKIICDYTYQSDGTTPQTVNGTHRICALRLDYNAEIYGLNLYAVHTWYAVHDDYGSNSPYTNIYENCYVEGSNLANTNCIGGGCKGYSRHILKNSYFNNNVNDTTVRYHNTNSNTAAPEIYVSNCYFNNAFTPRWYGSQTTKMKVYVNNCYATAIYKMQESSSYNVDNVDLYKWNNTETNPI